MNHSLMPPSLNLQYTPALPQPGHDDSAAKISKAPVGSRLVKGRPATISYNANKRLRVAAGSLLQNLPNCAE